MKRSRSKIQYGAVVDFKAMTGYCPLRKAAVTSLFPKFSAHSLPVRPLASVILRSVPLRITYQLL